MPLQTKKRLAWLLGLGAALFIAGCHLFPPSPSERDMRALQRRVAERFEEPVLGTSLTAAGGIVITTGNQPAGLNGSGHEVHLRWILGRYWVVKVYRWDS
jgi:hypothetical protein